MVFSWIYVSQSLLTPAQVDTVIPDIVAVSRKRNAGLAVTGALVLAGERFAQLLEGERAAVEELQASIRGDVRHAQVTDIEERFRKDRWFGNWSLQYVGRSNFFSRLLSAIELGADRQNPLAAADVQQLFAGYAREPDKPNKD